MTYFTVKEFHSFINRQSAEARWQTRGLARGNGVGRNAASYNLVNNNPNYAPLSLKEARAVWREAHRLLTIRDRDAIFRSGLSKWYRPWDVVHRLRNIVAPSNDFTVGVEVEMGFTGQTSASTIAQSLIKMKNVTLDWEGGTYPIEATFPPILYSKFDRKAQATRYIKLLQQNRELVASHPNNRIGTHVNVGCADFATRTRNGERIRGINAVLPLLNNNHNIKYFGRTPYGYGFVQGNCKWVEWKLFLSTTDPVKFLRYVDIAVKLTALACSSEAINLDSVLAACERGYNKRTR